MKNSAFYTTGQTQHDSQNLTWLVDQDSFDWLADGSTTTTEQTQTSETATTTYSEQAISDLLFMIEEEKLAGDVYEAFYEQYGLTIFDNIAQSEDQHFSALINQAEQIGLDVDQFLLEPAGSFVNDDLQALFDTLLATGNVSVTAALEVGVAIEEKDMVDIAATAKEVEGTTLASVYENLLDGSANHLEAFQDALLA